MSLHKNVITVGGLTFISRIFGYVRDIFFAAILGAGALNDAFIIAFRLPNLFRTIFGEGAFNASFVPLFSHIHQKYGKAAAMKFAQSVQTLLILTLIALCALMIFFMPEFMALTAPGYSEDKEVFDLIVLLGRITFPYIIFVSLMAFYGGILNSFSKFYAFASAPILLNIVFIIFVPLVTFFPSAAHAMSYAALIGGIVELLWMMYFASKMKFLVKLAKPEITDEVKKLIYRMGPGLLGSGVAQINIWISTIIASFIIGGNSFLYYADRIYQLPLAIIGTAMGTVLLPILSKNFSSGNIKEAIATQNKAIDFCMLLTIPATIGIAFLSYDLIHALFEHGNFSADATIKTASALFIFSFGLPAYVLIKVFSSNFFALGDTKTPVKIAFISLLINVAISLAFLPYYQHVAVAFGSVVAAWFNSSALWAIAHQRKNYRMEKALIVKILKIIISSLLMLIVLLMTYDFFVSCNKFFRLFILISFGIVSFGGSAYMFKLITKEQIKKVIAAKR